MMENILPKIVVCMAVLVLLAALPASAAVFNVSGAADTEDTWVTDLLNGEVNYNYGGSDFIEIGDKDGDGDEYDDDKRYGLLKWDLSGLAALAGAGQRINVSDATVTLHYTGTGDPDIIVNLYYVTEANADWVEGTSDGTTAVQHVEPSWRYKSQELITWASGQDGLQIPGIDYEYDPNDDPNTPAVNCDGNDQTGVDDSKTVSIDPEKVEEWVNTPSTNGGLLLKQKVSAASLVKFISSDNASTTQVPVLMVTYTIGTTECGDAGTGQLVADISGPNNEPDCKVDSYDLDAFINDWLGCGNPHDLRCGQ